jgi:heme/copper-type cytochrome/quinol oxidase subunit 1
VPKGRRLLGIVARRLIRTARAVHASSSARVGASLRPVRHPLSAAVLLGVLNGAVAVMALALVEVATPDQFGWFAYAPLQEVVVRDPRFPWHYVVVPLSLVVTNVLAVTAYLRRALQA